jgi:hypothetical protein
MSDLVSLQAAFDSEHDARLEAERAQEYAAWRADVSATQRRLAEAQADEAVALLAAERSESRARAIRAVVAAQWGVACALLASHEYGLDINDPDVRGNGVVISAWDVATLPTAEQIVDGVTT